VGFRGQIGPVGASPSELRPPSKSADSAAVSNHLRVGKPWIPCFSPIALCSSTSILAIVTSGKSCLSCVAALAYSGFSCWPVRAVVHFSVRAAADRLACSQPSSQGAAERLSQKGGRLTVTAPRRVELNESVSLGQNLVEVGGREHLYAKRCQAQ